MRTRDDLTNDLFVMSQILAHLDDLPRDARGARERPGHGLLAAFDPLRQGDFLLTCQQGNRPDLAQVRPHGIGRFLGPGRAQIEFVHTRISAVAWSVVLLERRRLHEGDAGMAKRVGEGLQVIRPGEVCREERVDLLVQEIPLLLPDRDQLPNFLVPVFNQQWATSGRMRALVGGPYAIISALRSKVRPATDVCVCRGEGR